jgi:hypothetical protein
MSMYRFGTENRGLLLRIDVRLSLQDAVLLVEDWSLGKLSCY